MVTSYTAFANSLIHRFESFLLQPDEKKVEEKIDTRKHELRIVESPRTLTTSGMPNTSYFHFNKEDHTLANLLRSKLLSSSHILFAAYRVPHPLFPTFELRVQTDGEITPKEAVTACCKDLVGELAALDREFKREYELRKMVGQDQNGI